MAARKKAKKKTKAKRSAARRARTVADHELDELTIELIMDTAGDILRKICRGTPPRLSFPQRSLANVEYDAKKGYFQIGSKRKHRELTVSTVKTFAQTLKMMALSKEMVESENFATKREAYYVSKNWGEARFKEQPESDTIMDDIEALFSMHGISREQLRFNPEEKGGAVAGSLIIHDRHPRTGAVQRIDCTHFGSGAYSIPTSVEHLRFETKAKFILAVETSALFQRLNGHGYWDTANCIIIAMGGVPTRATRRFVRRLADSQKIPVYAFTDGDPYGYTNIYRTLKVGSGNAAHVSEFYCVPQVHFLGVTPQDIEDFDLRDATHPLDEKGRKRAEDALKNDPFIKGHRPWQRALKAMLKMGRRVEQQAFAKHGLNYVIDDYLPAKLAAPGKFLP